MADFTVEIKGLDELEQRLREEGPKAARKAIAKASARAGEIIRAAIEARAPRLTGFLEGHIVMKGRANASAGSYVTVIGPEGDIGYLPGVKSNPAGTREFKFTPHYPSLYARFYEFGTKHQPARPFMGPAFEDSSEEALQVFVDEIWNAMKDLEVR